MYIIPSSRQIAWEIAPDAKLKAGTDFWTQPPPSKPLNVPDTCVLTKLYQNGQFLGRFYMEKSGVEGLHMEARDNDDAKAVEFFERAAAQGDANAETNLGWMYHEGKGVPQDYRKAVELFQKAADFPSLSCCKDKSFSSGSERDQSKKWNTRV